jgi:zinc/manganese transport system substrate-binding protein
MSPLARRRFGMLLTLACTTLVVGCGPGSPASARHGTILAVAAENEYANVIAQIGGRYVSVSAVESNPNTDPHSFEASPSVAESIAAARLIVQNGAGYDPFMDTIEAASASPGRRVIVVQRLLGLPAQVANPHLWYRPTTMPRLANALARDLAALEPAHGAYFEANARRFDRSLAPWYAAIKTFARRFPRVPVATTEPVGDYLLAALGAVNRTPFALQADVMNGVDPAPENVSIESGLLEHHRVRVFVYNEQVTDSLTASFLAAAEQAGIPVVGVYETMPAGFDYQGWMLAEVRALTSAVADGRSTGRL